MIATIPGFIEKVEIVEVTFDPSLITYEALVHAAEKSECAAPVFAINDEQHAIAKKIVGDRAILTDKRIRLDKEPKYYLSKTALNFLPMTGLQAVKVNANLKESDWKQFLSSSQLSALAFIEAHPDAKWKSMINKDFMTAWQEFQIRRDKIEKND